MIIMEEKYKKMVESRKKNGSYNWSEKTRKKSSLSHQHPQNLTEKQHERKSVISKEKWKNSEFKQKMIKLNSDRMKINNPMKREEVRKKSSESHKGRKRTLEEIEKTVSKLRNIPRKQEIKDKISYKANERMRLKKLTPEYNIKLFSQIIKKLENKKYGKRTNVGSFTGEYNGNKYKSSYELAVMKYFVKNNIRYEYEKYRFKLTCLSNKFYRPDFFLPEQNLFIEVKGTLMTDTSWDKISYFWFEYPKIKLEIWSKKDLEDKGILEVKKC